MDSNTISPQTKIWHYVVLQKIGKGSYGDIFSVKNTLNNNLEVFKVLRPENKFVKSQLNEIAILNKLKICQETNYKDKREYISLIIDKFFYERNYIIIMKKYQRNLYQEYKAYGGFSANQVIKISCDLLRGLQFLRLNKIIHGDLKPENILFMNDSSFRVVICDFSLSIDYDIGDEDDMNNYNLQSIWYRAPEILFYLPFDYNIDLWSLGCIIYEIYFMRPLFSCKTDEELFDKMYIFLGKPCNQFIVSSKVGRKLFNLNYELTYNINNIVIDKMIIHNENISERCLSNEIKTLMLSLLTWEPKDRPSLETCLKMLKN